MKLIKAVLFLTIFSFSNSFAQSDNNNRKENSIPQFIPITVTIGGDFIITGSFSASPTQRVDHFITQVYLEAKREALKLSNEFVYSKKILKELDKYSQRNIVLKRANGTEKVIDLERFKITGDFENNPYLLNDDVLIFPAIDIEKDFIAIEGAVNKPTTVQYVEGDKLSDAILFAMGISKAYDNVEKAEITRLSYDGKNEQVITVNIKDDFDLQRGDRIRIAAEETNKKDFRATVMGQVNLPGEIFLTKDGIALRDVIKKAGGFKSSAWVDRMQLYRGDAAELLLKKEGITEIEIKDIERRLRWSSFEMSRLSNLTVDDTLLFAVDNELRFYNQVGNLDFANLEDPSSEAGNFIVKDGDLIIIPEFENVVNVFGQVPNSGKYNFVKGYDYKYYINKAGGFGEFAEDDEVILIKGKGKNWIPIADKENVAIEPGDFIWVPKEPQRTLEYYLKQAGIIAGILGPIATIVVILVTNSGGN